jgi:predicted lipoprotein with Yx(FWY)xxD motif
MRRPSTRRWLTTAVGAAALAAALGGCGSDDDANDSGTTGAVSSGDEAGAALVSTRELDGLGTVLVDDSGRALYFAEQETDGTIQCVDACLGFWTPATATGSLPTDISGLDTIQRDDTGDRQLTYDGAPLYTFTLDKAPGQVTGNDLTDTFDGVEFTWHAAVTDAAADTDGGGDDGGGYGGDPYSY